MQTVLGRDEICWVFVFLLPVRLGFHRKSQSYYRRYFPTYLLSQTHYLPSLAKDAPFEWSKVCQTACLRLKETLASSSALAFPDFSRQDFILETDASKEGLGAVCLSVSKLNPLVATVQLLLLTIKYKPTKFLHQYRDGKGCGSIEHFGQYLYRHKYQVSTDHIYA